MDAANAVASDPILLYAWNRDYRLSLAVIVVGIVVVAAVSAFALWANLTVKYPLTGGTGLAISLIGTAGFMLIVLGGSWAYTNRRLLQLSRRNL
jgi:hypothetical protein